VNSLFIPPMRHNAGLGAHGDDHLADAAPRVGVGAVSGVGVLCRAGSVGGPSTMPAHGPFQ